MVSNEQLGLLGPISPDYYGEVSWSGPGPVPTVSGTTYELLDPDPAWLAWMEDEGIPFDEDNPLRIVSQTEIAARNLGDQ